MTVQLNYRHYQIIFLTLLCTVLLSACSTLRNIEAQHKDPPEAVIGDPLVFDGRRLLQEFSERRLQIDNEIKNTKIEDVDTVGRTFRSRAVGIGVSVTGTRDPREIALIDSNRTSQIDQNANAVELQNIYMDSLRNEYAARDQANSTAAANAQTQQQLTLKSAENYAVLTDYYRDLAVSETDPEEKKKAIEQLQALQNEVTDITIKGTASAPVLPIIPPAVNGTAQPAVNGVSGDISEVLSGQLPAQLSENEQLNKLLGGAGAIESTRRQSFQQYQSYLDELYSYRNRYVLDDTHRSRDRRMVRLVFPIYVSPSTSAQASNVEFHVSAEPGDEYEILQDVRLQETAFVDALNYLANDSDDQAKPLSFTEILLDNNRMFTLYSSYFNGQPECNTGIMAAMPETAALAKLSIENINRREKEAQLIPDEQLGEEKRNVYTLWNLLNTARKVGLAQVASACLTLDVDKGWVTKTDDSTLIKNINNSTTKGSITVYAMNPLIEREKVEQTLSRILSLGATIGSNFGGSSSLGNASISAGLRNQLLAQSAAVTPVIAANQYRTKESDDEVRFGWTVYPQFSLQDGKRVVQQHIGTSFYGSVDFSVPLNTQELKVSTVINGVEQPDSSTVRIPTLTYDEVFANVTTFPTVTTTHEFGIVDPGQQFSLLIDGYNLWRDPTVYIGGQPHNSISFASGNENYLRASFDNLKGVSCDYLAKNYGVQGSLYHSRPINPDERCAARIWIHTAAGRDYVGSLVLEKTKSEKPKTAALSSTLAGATIEGNDITFTWIDKKDQDYVANLKKGETTIVAKDVRRFGSKRSINLVYQEPIDEPGDKNTLRFTAKGRIDTRFCLDQDGKAFDGNCQVDLEIGKRIIVSDLVRITDDRK